MHIFDQIDMVKLARGIYEAENLPRDFSRERFVPDFAYNILNPLGLLYRPIIDEDYLKKGGTKPSWPDGKAFAVCLTHDVDYVSSFSLKERLRARRFMFSQNISNYKKMRIFLGGGGDVIQAIRKRKKDDPLHRYEEWINLEKSIGAHSTFFFWPGLSNIGKRHQYDCPYELDDKILFQGQECIVSEMIVEIDRMGWEIGLHPSWYSYDDLDELKRQKAALENIIGHEIHSIRQHRLHYDIRVTPYVQSRAGFKYDSSLGFNDNIGFRFGTSYPWHLYDLKTEEVIGLMEIPLVIQDGAMLNPDKGMRLDQHKAFEYVTMITDTIQKVGGVLTLLWHPHSIAKNEWWDLYNDTLNLLQKKKPWFGAVRDIGKWWEDVITKR